MPFERIVNELKRELSSQFVSTVVLMRRLQALLTAQCAGFDMTLYLRSALLKGCMCRILKMPHCSVTLHSAVTRYQHASAYLCIVGHINSLYHSWRPHQPQGQLWTSQQGQILPQTRPGFERHSVTLLINMACKHSCSAACPRSVLMRLKMIVTHHTSFADNQSNMQIMPH